MSCWKNSASRTEFNKGINTITCRTWSLEGTTFFFFSALPNSWLYGTSLGAIFIARLSLVGERRLRRERRRAPPKVVKMQMHRLRERLPAVPKPSGNLLDESTSPPNAVLKVPRAPQFANMYYERRKGKYFGDDLKEYERTALYILGICFSHEPRKVQDAAAREKRFPKREEIYE